VQIAMTIIPVDAVRGHSESTSNRHRKLFTIILILLVKTATWRSYIYIYVERHIFINE